MVKFHGLKVRKESNETVLKRFQSDVQKTIRMQRKMKTGRWVHRDEVDTLEDTRTATS